MRYIASTIPASAGRCTAALLHTAADIVATNPDSVDAIREAAIAIGFTGDTGPAESVAVKMATTRCHTKRSQLHELDRKYWMCWQAVIDEPWPILVDAAGVFTEPCDEIEPGRWEL